MAIFDRERSNVTLPQLEKRISEIDNSYVDIDTRAKDGTRDGNLLSSLRALGWSVINPVKGAVDIKLLISKILRTDLVIESGTTSGWAWKKYASGKYEAERYINIGQVTAGTVLASTEGTMKLYVTAAIPTTAPQPPHTLTSGYIIYDYVGNSSGYSLVLKTTDGKIQLGRLSTTSYAFQDVALVYRVVDGKWK